MRSMMEMWRWRRRQWSGACGSPHRTGAASLRILFWFIIVKNINRKMDIKN
jgi:hypothetical protein